MMIRHRSRKLERKTLSIGQSSSSMIKALIFDVDDTLIRMGTDRIADSTIRAIEMARANGLKIIVATGRGYRYLHQDVKQRVKADYYVMVNGGCVNATDGTTVLSHPMTAHETETIIKLCMERDYAFAFKFDDSLQIYNRYEYFISKYCNKAIKRENLDDNSDRRDYHLVHGMPLDAFIYSENNESMDLKKLLPELNYYAPYNYAMECYGENVNKGNTLRELFAHLKLEKDECMAFGDGDNDIEMLKMCGIGVCMGNGTTAAKQAADYVTDDIDSDGIYNALKHYEVI